MSDKKRINYTLEEKKYLIEVVNKFKHIIENKETNAVCNSQKESAWKNIEGLFNTRNINVRRDSASLRKQWSNMKQESRKKAAKERQEIYRTGGGSTLTKPSCDTDLVLTIVNTTTIQGLENNYDLDSIVEELPLHSQEPPHLDDNEEVPVSIQAEPQLEPTRDETNKGGSATPKPRWSARRRPKSNVLLNPVDAAKTAVLEAQRDLYLQEIEFKKQMYEIEVKHKLKLYEREENNCFCNNNMK